MNVIQTNVVSNDCGLKWTWSQMNVVSNEQVSNVVVSDECGLKWMVSNELVSIVCTPGQATNEILSSSEIYSLT